MTLTRSTVLKPHRTRKCAVKGCATRFRPRNMMHKCCGAECAEIFAVAERKRLDAKQTRERKQEMKTRSDWPFAKCSIRMDFGFSRQKPARPQWSYSVLVPAR